MAEQLIPEGHNLFVIDIRYTAGPDRIEPLRESHMAFIAECLAEGFILVSGPKVPRTGGMIIAVAPDRAAVTERMAQDPFVREGVIALEVTEFTPGTQHPVLAGLSQ
ncbi:YciI family protein [Sagittula sp. SSi028]|uniref:YciI family protein n=1 Tax=Sagittula sp. SSi028 TaxID=3400636 RepID=UPI003AF82B16